MHYAKNHHQSLGLKFCFRLQMFRKLLSSLLISGSLTKASCFVPNCNNKTFWLHYRPGLCPCWLLLYRNGGRGSWVFKYYCSEPPEQETLLPEQHICGFVIFMVLTELSRQCLSHWWLTILCPNWSPVCVHICIHCAFVLLLHSSQLPYL